jgi:hypothetical protein
VYCGGTRGDDGTHGELDGWNATIEGKAMLLEANKIDFGVVKLKNGGNEERRWAGEHSVGGKSGVEVLSLPASSREV